MFPTCRDELVAGVADFFRLYPTVAYRYSGSACLIRQTRVVTKHNFSAAAAVKVFTRNPGQGIRVIPRKTGSLHELGHSFTLAY